MDREMDAGRDGGGDPSEDHQGVGHAAGCLNRQRLAQYRVRHTGSALVADAAVRTADIDFWWPFEPQRSSRDFRLHVRTLGCRMIGHKSNPQRGRPSDAYPAIISEVMKMVSMNDKAQSGIRAVASPPGGHRDV